jgi:hypothetical protein
VVVKMIDIARTAQRSTRAGATRSISAPLITINTVRGNAPTISTVPTIEPVRDLSIRSQASSTNQN